MLIDKEENITSYDVIRKLKKVLPKGQKIGHAGTLDPFATGLLVILLGKATRKFSDFQKMHKIYEAEAEFGIETDTGDITGKTTNTSNIKPEKENIIQTLNKFSGKIMQTPPTYSAKKVQGKKAYELARKGENPKLKPVEIEVYKFELTSITWPNATFLIECSSGTYIRQLVVDLAHELGVLGTTKKLRRTAIGKFKAEQALKSEEIKNLTEKSIVPISHE